MKFKDRCAIQAGRNHVLPIVKLVEAFLLSRDVRSNRRLKTLLSNTVTFALDPSIAKVVLKNETWSVVPDPTVFSTANLQIGIAFYDVSRRAIPCQQIIKAVAVLEDSLFTTMRQGLDAD